MKSYRFFKINHEEFKKQNKHKNLKTQKMMLVWLLCAAMLCGCSAAGPSSGSDGKKDSVSGAVTEEAVEGISEEISEGTSEGIRELMTENVSEKAAGDTPEESSTQASGPDTEEKTGKTGSADEEDEAQETEKVLPLHPFAENPAADPEPAYLMKYMPGYLHLVKGIFRPVTDLPLPEKSLSLLRQQLEKQLAGYAGTWSVAVRELDNGEQFVINDIAMPSASVLKLFIMACTYQAIEKGQLQRTSEMVELIGNMIRASSNDAANRLFYLLGGEDYAKGIDAVNAYIQEQGYSDRTIAYNPFQNSSLTVHPGKVNQTCAADCAELLSRIYHRTLSRRKVCNEIEEMLLGQGTRYKIPKAIPDSALVGNKTGETDSIENDVALIFTPVGDYILCVFSTDWPDKKQAEARITEVSAAVYAYFTDPGYVEAHYPRIQYIGDFM